MVFDQRDKVTDNSASSDSDSESLAQILSDIRDSIKVIEANISKN